MSYLNAATQLDALFGAPAETSLRKEAKHLHPVYRDWIARSPFAVLATQGPDGMDTSPRGDPAPLVRMPDDHTVLLPERRGNNRVDSLRNILADPRVSLIFFVPGINETVRVNGTARLNVDPALLASFTLQDQAPKCVIEVAVQAVFFQCAKALVRSRLWAAGQPAERPPVPTAGQMLAALTQGGIDGVAYDQALPARQVSTLY
jgi:PPOX class probable FMN-dependent enzyme